MQKYEAQDRRLSTVNPDLSGVDKDKIQLHDYLELLEARNTRELKQLNTVIGRLKTKVNGRRTKLGLESLN